MMTFLDSFSFLDDVRRMDARQVSTNKPYGITEDTYFMRSNALHGINGCSKNAHFVERINMRNPHIIACKHDTYATL